MSSILQAITMLKIAIGRKMSHRPTVRMTRLSLNKALTAIVKAGSDNESNTIAKNIVTLPA